MLLVIFLLPALVPPAYGDGVPRIECDQPVYEFGTMDNAESIEHTFLIWNRGTSPLQIGKIRACCGATAKMPTKTIEPGTNVPLRVTLSLRRRQGKQRKSIYIGSNDPRQPYLQVRLLGTAVAAVTIEPRFVRFGDMEATARAEQKVKITSNPDFAFQVTNVTSSATQFIASVESDTNGCAHEVTVKTVPPLPLGTTTGRIKLFTDNPKRPDLSISTAATVLTDIMVVPKEISVKASGEGQEPATRYVAIRSRHKRRFKILKVQVPDPRIQTEFTPLGAGYRCELKNIPPDPSLDGKPIIISTDHPESPQIPIPLRILPATP